MAQQPTVGHDLLIVEATRSHSDTPHSIGFLWTSVKILDRDPYMTTHNTDNRETSMPPAGFEPAIPTNVWPQTQALERAAIGTGKGQEYKV
jgi:hypothetical protein